MRCFLAAWPDETARQRCAQLTDAVRPHAVHGRVMRADNLHLTLAFIGDLPDTDAPGIATACAALPPVQHDWHLDAIGFFARPRVLWAGGPLTPDLAGIADRARALLDDLKVSYDRKPFVPHVTLLRDVRRFDGPNEIRPPIPWAIREVALYRSGRDDRGARYFRVEPA
jgi:2'-5' RNA ligase